MGYGLGFEQYCKDILEKDGYFVIRSYASHGPNDLLAINKDEKLFIQCKRHKVLPKITRSEHDGLWERSVKTGGKPIVMFKLQARVVMKPLIDYEENYLHYRRLHKIYLEEREKQKHGRRRKRTATKERKVGELLDDYTRKKKQKGFFKRFYKERK
jgi:Holliday junction resolvase